MEILSAHYRVQRRGTGIVKMVIAERTNHANRCCESHSRCTRRGKVQASRSADTDREGSGRRIGPGGNFSVGAIARDPGYEPGGTTSPASPVGELRRFR